MNLAEWILVMFLATALLVFLILAIALTVKLIRITKEAQKIVITGQSIAEKTDDIVDNVKDMTTVGGVIKTIAKNYEKNNKKS